MQSNARRAMVPRVSLIFVFIFIPHYIGPQKVLLGVTENPAAIISVCFPHSTLGTFSAILKD
jgi:hypothetical protein